MRIRRDTRRRLDQFIANPNCPANVISAVHDIPMIAVAKSLGIEASVGQSPFAIGRGVTFERTLYADDAERLRRALVEAGVLAASSTGFADLRLRVNGGKLAHLDEAREHFEAMLRDFAAAGDAERQKLPTIIAAPALRIPGRSILPDGMFAVDVVTVHADPRPAPVVLRVGEIKVYPDRGGYTDPHELASTRAQAGIYVHALRLAIDAAGVGETVRVDDHGFLVLTKPGMNYPSIRPREDLRYQALRAESAFERLRTAAANALPIEDDGAPDVPAARLAAVSDADTAYDEACVSFCELQSRCHQRAAEAGDGSILGRDVARFLGTIHLPRAAALLDGASPDSAAEEDFVRRAGEARRATG